MKQLDRSDQKILEVLQSNNQLTYHEIAERVSLSPSSCRRRIESLRRSGAILADVSIVNPEIVGERIVIVALVTLERDTPDAHAAFRRTILGLPEVLDCEFVAGHFDYVVRFKLASIAEYEALTDRYLTSDPAVKRVESLVVMKAIKGVHERFVMGQTNGSSTDSARMAPSAKEPRIDPKLAKVRGRRR